MGLISSKIDEAYETAKPGSQKMEAGIHEATITKLELVTDKKEIKRSWVDVELVITFETETGAKAWHRIELAPLTDKDGNPSPGKLGYVKGQLENIGYQGKLSEFEYNVMSLQGAVCRINVEDKAGTKVNPRTGKPYVNREVYVQELIKAGVGGSAGEAPSDDFVPPPTDGDDDDDIPF